MKYPVWHNDVNEKVTCVEKIKVMEQGLTELKQMAEDLLVDGILMGINRQQLQETLVELMQNLKGEI
jgi:hypothetical protein